MFEDSTFESTGRIKTRSRRWMLATLGMNGAILIALILLPLIYPDALPQHIIPALVVAPEVPQRETPQQPAHLRAAAPHDFSEMMDRQLMAPRRIPSGITSIEDHGVPFTNSIATDTGLTDGGGRNPFGNESPAVVVHPPTPSTVHLPSKLVEGFLIYKNVPAYPIIAKTAGIQGTVVLQATISKTGTIENLRVIAGSPMLQQAAIDAVKTWRYRPYLLNDQAVEVETTVSVIFKLER
jgi:periplasmic protein TonB